MRKKTDRRWVVQYDLAYDGGGARWDGHYTWRIQALIMMLYNKYIASWGGMAVLIDRDKGKV